MNKSARIVRRTTRTRQLLYEALGSLIREKPYDSIVVREILEPANVGRSTFYTHFRDKHDLLVSGIYEILGSAQASLRQPSTRRSDSLVWFSLPILVHIGRHRANGVTVEPDGWPSVHAHLQQALTDVIADDLKREIQRRRPMSPPMPPDLLARCVASTFVLTLAWWVESRSPLSPNEINDLFRSLIVPSLSRAVD